MTQRRLGERGGTDGAALSVTNLPSHTHQLKGVSALSDQDVPAAGNSPGSVLGLVAGAFADLYNPPVAVLADMAADHLAEAGAAGAHDNEQPHTVINFIIALVGVFPSRN